MPTIARINDKTTPHNFNDSSHADNKITSGSNDVYLNNRNVARENDNVSCGDVLAIGSNNVFVNNRSVARINDLTKLHNAKIITASENVFAN